MIKADVISFIETNPDCKREACILFAELSDLVHFYPDEDDEAANSVLRTKIKSFERYVLWKATEAANKKYEEACANQQ